MGGDFSIEENCKKNHMDVLGKDFHKCESPFKDINLYHQFDAPVLILNLPLNNEEAIISFKNALINAAHRIVGADDGEIDGIVKENSLILYDNVEGGAGYVNTIYEMIDDILKESILLVLTCECQKGCLKCLYSYRRRIEIPKIDKRKIIDDLKSLLFTQSLNEMEKFESFSYGDSQSKEILQGFGIQSSTESFSKINKISKSSRLKDFILAAKRALIITPFLNEFEIEWENNERSSWADILVSCKANGLKDLKLYTKKQYEVKPSLLDKLNKWNIESFLLEDYETKIGGEFTLIIVESDKDETILFLSQYNLSNISENPYYAITLNNNDFFESLSNHLADR